MLMETFASSARPTVKGTGDHAVALFPELPAGEMVRRTVCDLDAPPKKS